MSFLILSDCLGDFIPCYKNYALYNCARNVTNCGRARLTAEKGIVAFEKHVTIALVVFDLV